MFVVRTNVYHITTYRDYGFRGPTVWRGSHWSVALAVTGAALELFLLPTLHESGTAPRSLKPSQPMVVTTGVNEPSAGPSAATAASAVGGPGPGVVGPVPRPGRRPGPGARRAVASPAVQVPGFGGQGFRVPVEPWSTFLALAAVPVPAPIAASG